MTRTITFTIGWGALALLALAVVAIATAFTLTRTVGPPAPDTVTVWPQVVRTVDGQLTTPAAEDLDRTGQ